MIKKLLLLLVAVVAIFLAVAAMQPDDFRVSRSTTIAATPAVLFDYANDLHKWQEWSPWAKLDPAAKGTYTGPAAGVGAAFSWSGNNQVGEGTMTITESKPGELVRYKLDFKKPFEGSNIADIAYKAEGDTTLITWSMSGKKNLIFKAMGLIMNCDKMCGDQFNQGLESLRKLTETAPKP